MVEVVEAVTPNDENRTERVARARSVITYPMMRAFVVSALESLADREYQQRVWIDRVYPHADFYDELQREVHILFDDIPVMESDDDYWVGSVLFPSEVRPIYALGQAFRALIDDFGHVPDEVYLADPRWNDVVALAQVAHAATKANDVRYPDLYLGMSDPDPEGDNG